MVDLRISLAGALALILGCSGSSPPGATTPGAEPDGTATPASAAPAALSPALEPLAWWLGAWDAERGASREHWVAAGGALYGIVLASDASFEVMIVDDGDGRGAADGALRFIAMPDGKRAIEFRATASAAQSVTFANPAHDDPREITYQRDGTRLVALLGGVPGAARREHTFRPAAWHPAPELEAADLAFAAATAADGIDGWVEAFAPDGGMIIRSEVIPHDEIAIAMGPTLAAGRFAWAPIASGMRLGTGFTVGIATYTAATPAASWRSSYATIWVKRGGAWKVRFDTGRTINE